MEARRNSVADLLRRQDMQVVGRRDTIPHLRVRHGFSGGGPAGQLTLLCTAPCIRIILVHFIVIFCLVFIVIVLPLTRFILG